MTEYHTVTFQGTPSPGQLDRWLELNNLRLQVRCGVLPRELWLAEADIAFPAFQPPRSYRQLELPIPVPLEATYTQAGVSL